MKLYKLTLNGWYQGFADKDDLNKLKEHGFTIKITGEKATAMDPDYAGFVRAFTPNKYGEYE